MKFQHGCSAFFIIFILCSSALATPTISPEVYFDFKGDTLWDSSYSIATTSTFSANIYISGFGDEEGGLISGGVEFKFDPTQLQVNFLELDNSNWNLGAHLTTYDNVLGSAALLGGYLNTVGPTIGYSGTTHLGSVEFLCIAEGVSNLDLYKYMSSSSTFSVFVTSDGTVWDEEMTFNSTIITQTPVPEPTTMLLFGIGIAGFAAIGRRKKWLFPNN